MNRHDELALTAMQTAVGEERMNSSSRLYDAVMRLPIVAFTVFFLAWEIWALRALMAAHAYLSDYGQLFVSIAARISTMMFLVLLAALHLFRYRPVRKYTSWGPKLTALLGLVIVYASDAGPAGRI